jgi:hypothetical protein
VCLEHRGTRGTEENWERKGRKVNKAEENLVPGGYQEELE